MDNRSKTESPAPLGYIPVLPYNDKRMLDAHRTIVPPPTLDYESGRPAFIVDEVVPFQHGSSACGNPVFLTAIQSCYKLQFDHAMLEWQYESRREAQPILPFLLLGPSSVARDQDFIESKGITFILAVRSASATLNRPNYLNPARFASAKDIETATLDLDTPYDLMRSLRPTLKKLSDHLEKTCAQTPIITIDDIKGKVLIFCESGNERSTVVVCAYIMVIYGVDAITAIQIVQSQRFCVSVEEGMKNMLLNLDTILLSERQIAAANIPQKSPQSLNKSSKRNIDRAYDSESDGDNNGNSDWNNDGTTRVGHAPFADTDP